MKQSDPKGKINYLVLGDDQTYLEQSRYAAFMLPIDMIPTTTPNIDYNSKFDNDFKNHFVRFANFTSQNIKGTNNTSEVPTCKLFSS